MKEEWICQVLVDIMAAREVPVEEEVPAAKALAVREEVPAGPEWVAPVWAAIGAAFVPWGTGLLPHPLPTADPEDRPGGAAAAACSRSSP